MSLLPRARRWSPPDEGRPPVGRSASAIVGVTVLAIGGLGTTTGAGPTTASVTSPSLVTASVDDGEADAVESLEGLTVVRHDDPSRSIVEDANGQWVATFTDGARTVALAGPQRRFDEATASHGVTSRTWVRVLDQPFDGVIDAAWLREARADDSADVLQVAMEYLPGSPEVRDTDGLLLSGEAEYGPLQPDGDRPVGADWNDYQQVTADYEDEVDPPEPHEAGAMDCSGYMRMVWGVRHDVPMTWRPDGGASLPRRSFQQAATAPGLAPIPDDGVRVTDVTRLQPGDLVFFDARENGRIDHVGMYLGPDDAGRHRFVSSRRSVNGPTMGDHGGPSLLDGDGLYARSFVSTRRL